MYKIKRKLAVAFFLIVLVLNTVTVHATEVNTTETNKTTNQQITGQQETNSQDNTSSKKASTAETLINIKEDQLKDIESYKAKYGSDTYGVAAYILHLIQVYSIPIGLVGIVICGIYEYVIGMKRLDIRDKGFNTMIAVITIMIICQILPLVFAIVVKSTD